MTDPNFNPLLAALAAHTSNPFLAALPPFLDDGGLSQAMEHRPILPPHVRQIPIESRPDLLVTSDRLRIAKGLQSLLYTGLKGRAPAAEDAKQFIYLSAQQLGKPIQVLPWNPSSARGMIIEAPTGSGKTHCVDVFLARLPQVICHGHEPNCAWRALKQLVYLKVHMPADGSRGGFLTAAFFEIDIALGTDYLERYRRWTIEKQLVALLHVLAVHRCGLLIIEEAQEQALSTGTFSADFRTFFLRILNWRIPLVLVGNPLAFTKIKHFAQDVDRFSEAGWHTLMPCLDPQSAEWREDWMPGLWAPTLLNEPDQPYPANSTPNELDSTLDGFVWKRTAGVPRYIARLRSIVNEVALKAGIPRITRELVDRVYLLDPRIQPLRRRIEAITSKRWQALASFDDMPVEMFKALLADSAIDSDQSAEQAPASSSNAHIEPKSAKSNSKTTETKAPEVEMRNKLKMDLLAASQSKATPRKT